MHGSQSDSIFHIIMFQRPHAIKYWQKLLLVLTTAGLLLGVKGCGPIRPLQQHLQYQPQQTSPQVPKVWFQPPEALPSSQQNSLVGGGASNSRLVQNSTTSQTSKSSIFTWSQLMNQMYSAFSSGYGGNSINHPPSPARIHASPRNYTHSEQPSGNTHPVATISNHGQPSSSSVQSQQSCPPIDPEKNKILVTTFYQQVFGDYNLENLHHFVHPNYIQHNPNVRDGAEGLVSFIQDTFSNPKNNLNRLLPKKMKLDFRRVSAVDDLVWVHLRLPLLGRQYAVMDLFRVQCGKIAEHWDVAQEITGKVLASSKNSHPFF